MKNIFLIIVLFCCSAAAQEKCELNNPPDIFGLKLGMSPQEVKRTTGGKLGVKSKPESSFFQNYLKKPSPAHLPGIRAIYLRFFESRLYLIEIFLKSADEKASLETFIDEFSLSKDLDRKLWKLKNGVARLNCDGFSIEVDNYLNLRIELIETRTYQKFKDSKKRSD